MTLAVETERLAELRETLIRTARDHGPAALSSSLSAEDMVITHVILAAELPIEILTLDTGRLHADTLELVTRVRRKYGYPIRICKPAPDDIAEYVTRHGRDALYDSVELRKECCRLRKVEPLKRALAGKRAWITGLRESPGRRERLPSFQFDETYGVMKVNPLAHWSAAEVWEYLRSHDVPYNRLYDHGYRSIGCAPCTRPTVANEDERAGRWWWEQGAQKECGLHVEAGGRLVRAKEPA